MYKNDKDMKKLRKITEERLTCEAMDVVNEIKKGDIFQTSEEIYTVREVTGKTIRCTTPAMLEWRSERKVFKKSKIVDLLESGLLDEL